MPTENIRVSDTNKHVLIGFETSCDDTGIALVNQDGRILSNHVHSQAKKHLWHGGIIPIVAREYHIENIDKLAHVAFKESGLRSLSQDVSAISVSNRPGLECSLEVGLNYARNLAKKYMKPLIPVHHMQAHALMPLLENRAIRFPYVALLLSGGHCIISLVKQFNDFNILGTSLDEAPGDHLDKFARRFKLKNLGPPFDSMCGGASIELLAKRSQSNELKYFNTKGSDVMRSNNDCDFSFSGYRGVWERMSTTFDNLWLHGDRFKLESELSDACASLQYMILLQIMRKLRRALSFYRMHWRYENEDAFSQNHLEQPDHLGFGRLGLASEESDQIDVVVSGGVASNSYIVNGIRMFLQKCIDPSMKVYAPSKHLCSDNGLMVAWNGMLHYRDYLHRRERGEISTTAVVTDLNVMDSITVSPDEPIGLDLRGQVKVRNFKLPQMKMLDFSSSRKGQ